MGQFRQELLERQDVDVVLQPAVASAVDQMALRNRVLRFEGTKTLEVFSAHHRRALDFKGVESALAVEDEIDLLAVGGSPKKDFVAEATCVVVRTQLLKEEGFQRGAVDLAVAVQRAARSQGPPDSDIEEVELGVGDELARRSTRIMRAP